ncbi:MAG TPA: helix-turn-helix transcriptional regulator [Catalimonadaceae bacterium]|nr:helix-turn-helix transcriptional regulator [Catalimonadaceae bacterium]
MNQKELLKGTLSTIILNLLAQQGKMYGYEIAQCVKEMSDGQILVKEGSLYPALHKLEADGHVQVEEVFIGKRVRRYYKLTPGGESQVSVALSELRLFLRTINQVINSKSIPTI